MADQYHFSFYVSKGQGESLLRCCGSFSFQELGNIFTPTENKLSYSFELMTKTAKCRSADSKSEVYFHFLPSSQSSVYKASMNTNVT